jgi:hypothetical protein
VNSSTLAHETATHGSAFAVRLWRRKIFLLRFRLSQHRTLPVRSPRSDIDRQRFCGGGECFLHRPCRFTIPVGDPFDEEVRPRPSPHLIFAFHVDNIPQMRACFERGLVRGWLFLPSFPATTTPARCAKCRFASLPPNGRRRALWNRARPRSLPSQSRRRRP